MDICVVGCGYVGLTLATCFAYLGNKVTGIDNNPHKIKLLNKKEAPIYEPHLELFLKNAGENISFTSSYESISTTNIVFITVPTPVSEDGLCNLNYIKEATKHIAQHINNFKTIVNKCTAPVGTTEMINQEIIQAGVPSAKFSVISNPEFLSQSSAVSDLLHPYRIIIGSNSEKSTKELLRLYYPIIHQKFPSNMLLPPKNIQTPIPIQITNPATAEMIKYASNCFLANKISFINEIGNICKRMNLDVYEVTEGMGHDPRIGNKYLNAGIGFGGSCLPKDLMTLIYEAKKVGYQSNLLNAVDNLNNEQSFLVLEIIKQKLDTVTGKLISILGLAFKPNTDDVRRAPSLKIIDSLLKEGAIIKVYDPIAMPIAKQYLPRDIKFCQDIQDAVLDSDCIVIATEWEEFKDYDLYPGKFVIDGRRALDPEKAKKICQYEGVCW